MCGWQCSSGHFLRAFLVYICGTCLSRDFGASWRSTWPQELIGVVTCAPLGQTLVEALHRKGASKNPQQVQHKTKGWHSDLWTCPIRETEGEQLKSYILRSSRWRQSIAAADITKYHKPVAAFTDSTELYISSVWTNTLLSKMELLLLLSTS
jgi:hypothetical protein